MTLPETELPLIPARVAAGVAWLDGRKPDWRESVAPGELGMTDCRACVLGQAFGNYVKAATFGTDPGDGRLTQDRSADLGFNAPRLLFQDKAAVDAYFAALQREWLRVLAAGREPR